MKVSYATEAGGPLQILLALTRDELAFISNALNEVCNGVEIDDAEFATRLGADRTEMRVLLDALVAAFDGVPDR